MKKAKLAYAAAMDLHVGERSSGYAIKAEIADVLAETYSFNALKTMYGGKALRVSDEVFIFASENEGGAGLFARGTVIRSVAVPRNAAVRQTPRINVEIRRTGSARLPCGREQLRPFRDWLDGQPQTELNFKLYRQATNKLVGLSSDAVDFLRTLF